MSEEPGANVPRSDPSAERRCRNCHAPLDGRRPNVVACSDKCRQELYRNRSRLTQAAETSLEATEAQEAALAPVEDLAEDLAAVPEVSEPQEVEETSWQRRCRREKEMAERLKAIGYQPGPAVVPNSRGWSQCLLPGMK